MGIRGAGTSPPSPKLGEGEQGGGIYPWGEEITPEHANYNAHLGVTSAVGCFPNGRTWRGAEDMIGNVWEWCQDVWHDNYDGAPDDGRAWISGGGSGRVCRGGSWIYIAQHVRCAFRFFWSTENRCRNLGFRLARTSS